MPSTTYAGYPKNLLVPVYNARLKDGIEVITDPETGLSFIQETKGGRVRNIELVYGYSFKSFSPVFGNE